MKQIKLTIFILLTVLFFSGCEKLQPGRENDFFFLRHEGADMPVWVKGKKGAEKMLIILHGGPGSTSFVYALLDDAIKDQLEEDYLIVYWEQRGSGSSQGAIKKETLVLEQFTEDLDRLIMLLNDKYNSPELYLLGHSWGGTLGTAYLLNEKYQQKINGWIEVNGAHNVPLSYQLMRDFVMNRAQLFIFLGRDVETWAEILVWCEDHPVIDTPEERFRIWNYMVKAGGQANFSNNGASTKEGLNYSFTSPHVPLRNLSNTGLTNLYTLSYVDTINLSPRMHQITTPSLILWGVHDGITPIGMALDAYESLGTPKEDKFLVYFEESGHSPMLDEPDKFADVVTKFMEGY